jgi:hypothetical protein|tara:strand:- start:147 stop:923 length:777 start_codon:yes stop_codon:yes gene_type:complete
MSNEEDIKEPIKLTREEAYKNVYVQLKNQDIAPWVEKKKVSASFQPDFLSWTHVWEFLLQTYPEFELEHLEPIKHDDGSMTVQCKLTIPVNEHILVRTERLYVMDNKMNAMKNPNGQAINKAEKRCFVKCAALFGLGIQLFTGEDLPEVDSVKPQPKPEAKPKTEPKPVSEPKPWPDPEPDELFTGWSGPTGAEDYVEFLIKFAQQVAKDGPDSVREIYSANKQGIDRLENERPELYKKLLNEMTNLTTNSQGDAGNE